MAWDEALLLESSLINAPVLRLYSWSEPAATFGYFQRYGDVEQMTSLRPLIRRPTGGGLVPHDADWTYSLTIPPHHFWYELHAVESYKRIHEWIRGAFTQVGLGTELSPVARKEAPGQCFIGAEQFDLLASNRKIAGAAQRRTRAGLLIQGSIQPPPKADRSTFEHAFLDVAVKDWGVEWKPLAPEATLLHHVRELAENKYSRDNHNRKK